MINNDFVPIRIASKYLGIHPQTLREWEKKGLIKPFRLGFNGQRRYDLKELEGLALRRNGEIKSNSR